MARDVLAIHVSIVASESSFSSEARVLDLYHCSLTPQMVEAFVCTQDWMKRTSTPLASNENEEFLGSERIKEESKLLSNWGIGEFPSILDGSTRVKEQPQDVSKDTLAPKVCEP
ncbi:hypothetical protein JHK87_016014 [Glycine soja]|nr:hypothetical protein JHK87_016014 [Glycine soja]